MARMTEPAEKVLRIATNRTKAEEWALVLASAGIPPRLERTSGGWSLIVAARDEERGTAALETYDEENQGWPGEVAEPPDYGRTYAGIAVAVLLVAFYLVTGPRDGSVTWFRRGSASAELILQGEVWRTVTALTLHATPTHIVSNAVGCALFATAVCRSVGPGVGWWLILLAGGGGNALNAFLHGSHHSAVGASTAIFGAIGILSGLQFVRRRPLRLTRRQAWTPMVAGLALLAMLGTGERTDVLAHLFGALVGAALGVAAASTLPRPPGPRVQWALALGAMAAVVGCWLVALT